ncbi:MAG: germination protein YpeB [Clostridiales bacterium]|nr:germination protein YpeB [Candidatus Apopatousia equi]
MEKETKSKIRTLTACVVMLIVLAGFLTVGYIGSSNMMAGYATQLENNYQRSIYELLTDVNNIENNLSKAIISTGKANKQWLYDKIYTDCTQANEDLSRLPINHSSVFQTTEFINEMGGFSYYLREKLKNGQDLSEDDNKSVNDLYKTSVYVKQILNDFMTTYQGNYSILANTKDIEMSDSTFNTMFSNMQAEGVEYPTLIYDGPFSASQVKKDIKGLSSEEVSKDDALNKLKGLYEDATITYEGETSGLFSTYNFNVKTKNNRDLFVQITKKGGFVLTISSYAESGNDDMTLSACETKAEEFASKLGLDLKAVWSTKISGMAYINLTPIKNGVIIYPDLVKVKINCADGEVVGYEAENYAYNHVERSGLTATISENTARSKVSSMLNIESQKLALIPIEYGEETLCYEYKCSMDSDVYYVYINAKTGEEENIMRVIKTIDGNLLM